MIIYLYCLYQDYKEEEDPRLFKSEKTGRGPLVVADPKVVITNEWCLLSPSVFWINEMAVFLTDEWIICSYLLFHC